jgi:hypothetical protein
MAERDIIARLVVEGASHFVAETQKAATAEEQLNQAIVENTQVQDQNAKKTISARQELKNLREELVQLARQGKVNTEEYRRLRDQAGQLADAIGDASAEIRQAGSDTRGLDKALRAATVLTGAFTAVQGATALFGKESENLQKALLRVQGALSILNGLQAVQEELSRKDSIVTGALAKAKLAYAAAVGTATGATKAFRIALISIGIGAVVVAIGALIANWDKLKNAIIGSTGALEDFVAAEAERQKQSDRAKALLDAQTQLELKRADILEKQGKKTEARLLREATLNKALQAAKQEENRLAGERAKLETGLQTEIDKSAQAVKRGAKETVFFGNSVQIVEKSQAQLTKELNAASDQINNKYAPTLSDLALKQTQAAEATASIELALISLDDETKKSTETTKKATDEIKAQAGSITDLTNKINRLRELQKATNDPKQVEAYQNQIDRLQAVLDKLNLRLNALQNKNVVIKLDTIPIEKFKSEVEKAAEAYEKLPEAIKKANAELANNPPPPITANAKSPEQIKAEEDAIRDFRIAAAQQTSAQVFAVFKQSQDAQQRILDNKLAQGLISEEEYARQVAEIRRKEAIAAKTQALFDIAINTAVAAINAFRNAKTFAGGVAFAAIIAALGAAQAAIVASTPIPKFFKGVKNFMGGLAWVGDGGKREPITSSTGELLGVSPDRPTLVNLPKGANVYRDIPTFKKEANIAYLPTPALTLPSIKEDKQLKSLERAMKKNGQKLEDLIQLSKQGNVNTRQTVNGVKALKVKSGGFYV